MIYLSANKKRSLLHARMAWGSYTALPRNGRSSHQCRAQRQEIASLHSMPCKLTASSSSARNDNHLQRHHGNQRFLLDRMARGPVTLAMTMQLFICEVPPTILDFAYLHVLNLAYWWLKKRRHSGWGCIKGSIKDDKLLEQPHAGISWKRRPSTWKSCPGIPVCAKKTASPEWLFLFCFSFHQKVRFYFWGQILLDSIYNFC